MHVCSPRGRWPGRILAYLGVLAAVIALASGVVFAADPLMIAPKYATWDGLTVVVMGGTASEVYLSFPYDGALEEQLICLDIPAGGSCVVSADNHADQIAKIRAVTLEGGVVAREASFEIRLARHVELGRFSFQLLEQILAAIEALPERITQALLDNLTVNPNGSGYQQFELAVENLQMSGVFGDVNMTADLIQASIDTVIAGGAPDLNQGPTIYRSAGTGSAWADATVPCDPNEKQQLSFCVPLQYGLPDASGAYQTVYFRLDIANHVRQFQDSYKDLWDVIIVGIWVAFAFWLVQQFVPKLTA